MARVELMEQIVKLMQANQLVEVELEDGDLKIRLKKESKAQPAVMAQPAVAAPIAAPAPGVAAPAAPAEDAIPANCHVIKSPIVGTFYRAQNPESEHFVELGDPVTTETVVCIVEAMKVMNEVKAEISGTIEKILVETGKPVEYGQPLFLVTKG